MLHKILPRGVGGNSKMDGVKPCYKNCSKCLYVRPTDTPGIEVKCSNKEAKVVCVTNKRNGDTSFPDDGAKSSWVCFSLVPIETEISILTKKLLYYKRELSLCNSPTKRRRFSVSIVRISGVKSKLENNIREVHEAYKKYCPAIASCSSRK